MTLRVQDVIAPFEHGCTPKRITTRLMADLRSIAGSKTIKFNEPVVTRNDPSAGWTRVELTAEVED
jgi:hypothetical protein